MYGYSHIPTEYMTLVFLVTASQLNEINASFPSNCTEICFQPERNIFIFIITYKVGFWLFGDGKTTASASEIRR
jgi:hypothetical protein